MSNKAAFFVGLGLAAGTGAALFVNALPPGSSGDLVYEMPPNVQKVPCASIVPFGQAAVNAGLWAGRAQDITEICVRNDEIRNACIATVRGLVSSKPGDVPIGTTIKGRIP